MVANRDVVKTWYEEIPAIQGYLRSALVGEMIHLMGSRCGGKEQSGLELVDDRQMDATHTAPQRGLPAV